MAIRRKEKRTERSKLDATPPWETARQRSHEPTTGPYDISDAPQDDNIARVDLTSLQIPVADGIEVRLDVDEATQITGVTLVGASGHMQLGLFAAPRNEGIWGEVRPEIMASVAEQGGDVAEQDGPFGVEITGKLPAAGGFTPVRFVGVDGPRWFLRAMLAGAPAMDDEAAHPFLDILRHVVVLRGTDALPVRDPVPLKLPAEAAEQLAQLHAAGEPDGG